MTDVVRTLRENYPEKAGDTMKHKEMAVEGRLGIEYLKLLSEIKEIITSARRASFSAVNIRMLKAYHDIGRKIVEEEQKGSRRARYGERIIDVLSSALMHAFGKGFDVSNLRRMRRFYLTYNKWETVSPKLTWSHYCELLKIDNAAKRAYFQNYTEQEALSVRNLKRQIYSLHYERLLMSKNRKALQKYENKENIPETESLIKDPYILEFLELDGIILCTEKDNVQVEYALGSLSNKLFVSKYKLYLPNKKELENELRRLL